MRLVVPNFTEMLLDKVGLADSKHVCYQSIQISGHIADSFPKEQTSSSINIYKLQVSSKASQSHSSFFNMFHRFGRFGACHISSLAALAAFALADSFGFTGFGGSFFGGGGFGGGGFACASSPWNWDSMEIMRPHHSIQAIRSIH